MKNYLTKIQNIGIQTILKNDNKIFFFNLKNKIKAFSQNITKQNNVVYDYISEFSIDDEILNYHVFDNFILLIGMSNKKIVLFNHTSGEKLREL